MKTKRSLLVVSGLLLAVVAWAQESGSAVSGEMKKAVLNEIERYVQDDIRLKGSFLIVDPRNGLPLRLAFDHVHEGVKPHSSGYVACVDFKDSSGKIYDVDVVVGPDTRRIQEVFLHKVDGQAVAREKKSKS